MIQKTREDDEGVVRCNQCAKTHNVNTWECNRYGWPRCCGLVMMLISVAAQRELGLTPEVPIPPHAPDSETSRDAAIFIRPKAEALRLLALRCFAVAGMNGLTDWELVEASGVIKDTIAARRSELKKAGFLRAKMRDHQVVKRTVKVGERTARPSTVWVITDEGFADWRRLGRERLKRDIKTAEAGI